MNINNLDKGPNSKSKLVVDLGESTVNLNQVGKGYPLWGLIAYKTFNLLKLYENI